MCAFTSIYSRADNTLMPPFAHLVTEIVSLAVSDNHTQILITKMKLRPSNYSRSDDDVSGVWIPLVSM